MGMPYTSRCSRGVCPPFRPCGLKVAASPGKLPAGAVTRSTVVVFMPGAGSRFQAAPVLPFTVA